MNWSTTVFLAHASEDKPFVRRLYSSLQENGLTPWLDEEDLEPGVKWDDVIVEAIKKSRFFVACLSKNSITKDGYVQKELRIALSTLEQKAPDSIYFIPALIEDIDLPNITVSTVKLSDYQAVKIFTEKGLRRLIETLKKQVSIFEEVKLRENPILEVVRAEIRKGSTEAALRNLIAITRKSDTDFYNSVLMLSNRFNQLHSQNVLGLINQEEFAMESNKIVFSILQILSMIDKSNS